MPPWSIQARPPTGVTRAAVKRDADVIAALLEDAAHVPGGRAAGVVVAASEADIAHAMAGAPAVLAIGAQSSLTGGATPRGELLISTVGLNRIHEIGPDRVRVGVGVPLAALETALETAGRAYPPAPTFMGAFVGGTIATNAAGAATFKYGTTRDWIRALTVVLPTGDVLDIERGGVRAHPDGYFDIVLRDRTVRVPLPQYHLPDVPKVSAGYFAAPGMDLIDLFIGSEGTLGVITEATLQLLPSRRAECLAFVPVRGRAAALALVGHLRDTARATWAGGSPDDLDVSAIEHMDRRCLDLLREDGADRIAGVRWPDDAEMALLITIEVPPGVDAEHVVERLAGVLDAAGVVDDVEVAAPGDRARAAQLRALREAVPAGVNQRVGRAKTSDPRIEKTAADMIVPFDRLHELMDRYDAAFAQRALDAAVWGHISDGNLHPNVIPRAFADVESGKAAMLELGRMVIAMGGSPLAEHGVGRNPIKQQLLRELYGEAGIEEMRRVKRALDPEWKLAPGVLFDSRGEI